MPILVANAEDNSAFPTLQQAGYVDLLTCQCISAY